MRDIVEKESEKNRSRYAELLQEKREEKETIEEQESLNRPVMYKEAGIEDIEEKEEEEEEENSEKVEVEVERGGINCKAEAEAGENTSVSTGGETLCESSVGESSMLSKYEGCEYAGGGFLTEEDEKNYEVLWDAMQEQKALGLNGCGFLSEAQEEHYDRLLLYSRWRKLKKKQRERHVLRSRTEAAPPAKPPMYYY